MASSYVDERQCSSLSLDTILRFPKLHVRIHAASFAVLLVRSVSVPCYSSALSNHTDECTAFSTLLVITTRFNLAYFTSISPMLTPIAEYFNSRFRQVKLALDLQP
jgi:hypothetical protein